MRGLLTEESERISLTAHEEGWKEIRVRIEPSHYQKLLALKILGQRTMSVTIHEALEHFFAEVLTESARASEPPGKLARIHEDDAIETSG